MDEHDDVDSAVGSIFGALRRRWWLIVLCAVIATVAAYELSNRQTDRYEANAQLLFEQQTQAEAIIGASQPQGPDADRTAATNVSLVGTRAVAAEAAQRLRGLGVDDVTKAVSVAPSGGSNLVTVTAADADARTTARIANAYADAYVSEARDETRSQLRDAEDVVRREFADLSRAQRQTTTGKDLRTSIQQLSTAAAVSDGGVRVVQEAVVPDEPVSPTPKRDALLGLLIGLGVGVALALLVDRLDRRLHDREQLERLFGRPVLATIPNRRSLRRSHPGRLVLDDGEPGEAIRSLRASLRYAGEDGPLRTLLLTSPTPGEGVTTVATQLAAAAAVSGQSVLLVEANLRRPRLRAALRLEGDDDLLSVLEDGVPVEQAVARVGVSHSADGDEVAAVDLLAASARHPYPQELLDSDRGLSLLELASSRYDLTIIDASPVALVPDATALVPRVDAVIAVTRLRRTVRPAVERLRTRLQEVHGRLIGVVVVGARDELSGEIRGESRRARSAGRKAAGERDRSGAKEQGARTPSRSPGRVDEPATA